MLETGIGYLLLGFMPISAYFIISTICWLNECEKRISQLEEKLKNLEGQP